MKIAVAFEDKTFERVHEEAEERGAFITEHIEWLVRRAWWLEQELSRRDEAEARVRRALRERERRTKAGGRV